MWMVRQGLRSILEEYDDIEVIGEGKECVEQLNGVIRQIIDVKNW